VQAAEGDGGFFLKELVAEGLADVARGEAVLVSEPLAWQAGLQLGDRLTLQAAAGPLTLRVAGVFYDYSTEGGIVALDPLLLQRAWPATAPARLVVHLAAAVEPEAVARALRAELEVVGQFGVAANADIRRITLEIFDRTFAITHVLRLLAIGVAFVGILSALLTLQLQRLRDYALLRACGMTVQETAGMILFQTTVMGLLAGLLALPLGLLMADVLIDVINRRSFGWTMQQLLPTDVLWQALLLSLVAALLAAWLPVRRVAGVRPAIGLRAT
jgi:putative ABC transport system permease protein